MKRKVFLAYCLAYGIWAAWSLTEGGLLPSGLAAPFLAEILVKAVTWLLPLGFFLLRRDTKWLLSPRELFSAPFPWKATLIGLCMAVAYLHTMHIFLVGIDTWGLYQPMWICLSVSSSVIEELSFRGLLFNLQAPTFGVKKAALVNGFLFALYHFPEFLVGQNLMALFGYRFWMITLMGMLFSLAFAKWRRLEMTMIIHFAWNMLCYWFALT